MDEYFKYKNIRIKYFHKMYFESFDRFMLNNIKCYKDTVKFANQMYSFVVEIKMQYKKREIFPSV